MKKRKEPKWHSIFNTMTEKDTQIRKDKVTNKELFLLCLVHKLRCISSKELSRLYSEDLRHSFIALCRAENKGFFYSTYTNFYGCKQRVFFVTNHGIEKMAELLGTTTHRFDKNLNKYVPNFYDQYANKIGSNYIPHFLAGNDFYLTLLKNNVCADWKDGRHNSLFEGNMQKAPIKVDASYTIGNEFYGIEQDMGTTSRQRLVSKFSTYSNYFPIDKFDDATIYFSINMGKYLDSKELNKLPEEFIKNEKVLKELQKEKKKYVEMKRLRKKYPAPPSADELEKLEQDKKNIQKLLESSIISEQERKKQNEKLIEINTLINKEYPKLEDSLEHYAQVINNPAISTSEKRRIGIKKEIILSYKQLPDSMGLDSKIKELTLQIRRLNNKNNKIRENRERDLLIKSAHKRREIVLSYIDYQVHNSKNVNTLLDLFRKGVNMYVDETILLAEFAVEQIKRKTVSDYLVKYIEGFLNKLVRGVKNAIGYNLIKKAKYNNLTFTVDCGIEVFRNNKTDKLVYIDIFDICDNNIASLYRFYEYMKTKFDGRVSFQNRLAICSVNSEKRIAEIIEKFPYELHNVWLYKGDKHDIDFNNMVRFENKELRNVRLNEDLASFFSQLDPRR